jgi:hypothetical protein
MRIAHLRYLNIQNVYEYKADDHLHRMLERLKEYRASANYVLRSAPRLQPRPPPLQRRPAGEVLICMRHQVIVQASVAA